MKKKLSELLNFHPKQEEAKRVADTHKYTLFGGSAGPGKSYFLRWYAIYKLIKWYKRTGLVGIRAGLFCEDYPSLTDRHVSKMQYEIPREIGTVQNTKGDGFALVLNPSLGAGVVALRNLDDPSKYLSSEFALILIDELTQNEKRVFDMLRMRNRWTGIEDTRMVMATNPGSRGHIWVKDIWIDKIFDVNEKEKEEFAYVKALPTDNPHLAESYIKNLQSLPEKLRKAYMEGDWNIFEGQYFSEWREEVHSCEPFAVPESWKRIRVIDHGRTAPTACLWGAIDYDGNIWWYKEYYVAGQDADLNAQKISEMSKGEAYAFTLLDSACFSKTGTEETIAEIYQRNGVYCQPSHKNRIAGWTLFHEYLRLDNEGKPKMRFFKTCYNAIRSIPTLCHDENHPEDLDTDGDDHCADTVSYALQFLHESKSPVPLDPLQQKFNAWKKKNTFNPQTLNRFYSNKMK